MVFQLIFELAVLRWKVYRFSWNASWKVQRQKSRSPECIIIVPKVFPDGYCMINDHSCLNSVEKQHKFIFQHAVFYEWSLFTYLSLISCFSSGKFPSIFGAVRSIIPFLSWFPSIFGALRSNILFFSCFPSIFGALRSNTGEIQRNHSIIKNSGVVLTSK